MTVLRNVIWMIWSANHRLLVSQFNAGLWQDWPLPSTEISFLAYYSLITDYIVFLLLYLWSMVLILYLSLQPPKDRKEAELKIATQICVGKYVSCVSASGLFRKWHVVLVCLARVIRLPKNNYNTRYINFVSRTTVYMYIDLFKLCCRVDLLYRKRRESIVKLGP